MWVRVLLLIIRLHAFVSLHMVELFQNAGSRDLGTCSGPMIRCSRLPCRLQIQKPGSEWSSTFTFIHGPTA
jgi:hypothetical protein